MKGSDLLVRETEAKWLNLKVDVFDVNSKVLLVKDSDEKCGFLVKIPMLIVIFYVKSTDIER